MKFELNKEEWQKVKKWQKEHFKTCTLPKNPDMLNENKCIKPIVLQYCWKIINTSIGDILKIECDCKVEFDLTNYDKW